ncbi:MAG: (2Fe-2S) ferredoxin domain-containing protein, partial [Dehalococcoidia bacterium]
MGAETVASLLRNEVGKRGLPATVVEAGCDGACYQAPVVTIETEAGRLYRLTHVEPKDVTDLVEGWLASAPVQGQTWKEAPAEWLMEKDPSGFWSGQTRLV